MKQYDSTEYLVIKCYTFFIYRQFVVVLLFSLVFLL